MFDDGHLVQAFTATRRGDDFASQVALVPRGDILVIERMVVRSSRMDAANDLTDITFLTGWLASLFPRYIMYTPEQWKGQMKKEVVHTRLARLITLPEGLDHNALDAVGIGLFHLRGRL